MSRPARSEPLPVHTKLAVGATLLAGAALLAGLWNGARVNRDADRPDVAARTAAQPASTASGTDMQDTPPPVDRDALWSADIAMPDDRLISRDGVLRARDTLADLLDRMGVTPQDSYTALQAVFEKELLDPRRIRPGLDVTATLRAGSGEAGEPTPCGAEPAQGTRPFAARDALPCRQVRGHASGCSAFADTAPYQGDD